MVSYKLNYSLSEKVYNQCRQYVIPKLCYDNVYHVAITPCYKNMFLKGTWKIAYGYVSLGELDDKMLYRHCFILSENDDVIDVTEISAVKCGGTYYNDKKYYIMKKFDSFQEYIDALKAEEFYPSLNVFLKAEDEQMQEWSIENKYFIIR